MNEMFSEQLPILLLLVELKVPLGIDHNAYDGSKTVVLAHIYVFNTEEVIRLKFVYSNSERHHGEMEISILKWEGRTVN
ncbi:unnamed protein product [Calypogeia fissa]